MHKPRRYVFVLWGDNFEEVTAAIFISELREAGLRVKMVSLNSQQTSGAHGLALVPDLTLTQALPLARQTICVIIPCALRVVQYFKHDPRLHEFFSLVQANDAPIFIGSLNGSAAQDLEALSLAVDRVYVYPLDTDLIDFSQQIAEMLLV